MACAASTSDSDSGGFDPALPYRLSPTVSLRQESFGALVYDFTTRRLSFLKTPALVRTVQALAEAPDVHQALAAAGVPAGDHPHYLDALAGLRQAGTIQPREPTTREQDDG